MAMLGDFSIQLPDVLKVVPPSHNCSHAIVTICKALDGANVISKNLLLMLASRPL